MDRLPQKQPRVAPRRSLNGNTTNSTKPFDLINQADTTADELERYRRQRDLLVEQHRLASELGEHYRLMGELYAQLRMLYQEQYELLSEGQSPQALNQRRQELKVRVGEVRNAIRQLRVQRAAVKLNNEFSLQDR